MVFLSQLLGKNVYSENQIFGQIIDLAIFQNRPHPPICKIEIRENKKKKVTISPNAIYFKNNKFYLESKTLPMLPYDHKDFYLAEDLLDKQVIDTSGKRLVRVNDVVLEVNGELKVIGIDVGFSGILRRLGFGNFLNNSKIIPWEEIEAFDYNTGEVKIKATDKKLNTFHPSELAEILENVGTKERLGIVNALDSKNAARAIEETDDETALSILEALPVEGSLKDILNKMRISELADVFKYLNSTRSREVQKVLNLEKLAKIKLLSRFANDTAGGLMHPTVIKLDQEISVSKALLSLSRLEAEMPEAFIVADNKDKFIGSIKIKNLIVSDPSVSLKDLNVNKIFVYEDADLEKIIKLFSMYNLRILPVINKDKDILGVILIDDILKLLEEEKENENL